MVSRPDSDGTNGEEGVLAHISLMSASFADLSEDVQVLVVPVSEFRMNVIGMVSNTDRCSRRVLDRSLHNARRPDDKALGAPGKQNGRHAL